MTNGKTVSNTWKSGVAVVFYIAVLKFAMHMLVQNYGYFRDELYFLACGDHLAWGYMDQPPLVALMAKISSLLFGTSLAGLHIIPALAGAVQVVLAGMLVREFGGKLFAQATAAIATALVPIYMATAGYLSMNCLEPVLWTLLAYIIVRIINTGNQRLWLWFGFTAGVGMENKYGIAFFAFALIVGILLTPERKAFFKPWIWIGSVIAFLIFLPNLIWLYNNGFPFIQIQKHFLLGKNIILSPVDFLKGQVFLMNPASCPLWLGGIYFYFTKAGKQWRALGWAFLTALLLFLVQKGTKVYFLAPAYIMLFASGAVLFDNFIAGCEAKGKNLNWLRPAGIGVVIAGGIILAPLSICILPPQQFISYMNTFRLRPPATENHEQSPLPQMYADMFGWEEMTGKVAAYYNSLPADERAKTAIFCGNYGECGAIDLLGGKYGLPKSIGGHMNYWIWGPRDYTGESIIVVGGDIDKMKSQFRSVTKAGDIYHPYAMPYENKPIWHCRGAIRNLQSMWSELKSY
ncbi:MAG: glycosyltransferase family 39 protein [Firmicutes bacterium]|nr:glycosyltransferase family 39 protein [Bacillota bacterium]